MSRQSAKYIVITLLRWSIILPTAITVSVTFLYWLIYQPTGWGVLTIFLIAYYTVLLSGIICNAVVLRHIYNHLQSKYPQLVYNAGKYYFILLFGYFCLIPLLGFGVLALFTIANPIIIILSIILAEFVH